MDSNHRLRVLAQTARSRHSPAFPIPGRRGPPGLQFQGFEILPELGSQILAAQGKLDRRFQKAKPVAGIVSRALKPVRVDWLPIQELPDAVGELDLTDAAGLGGSQGGKYLRHQDVPPDDGKI